MVGRVGSYVRSMNEGPSRIRMGRPRVFGVHRASAPRLAALDAAARGPGACRRARRIAQGPLAWQTVSGNRAHSAKGSSVHAEAVSLTIIMA